MSKLMLGAVCGVSVLLVAAVLPREHEDGAPGALAVPAAQAAARSSGAAAGSAAGVAAPAVDTASAQPGGPGTIAGNNPLALFEIVGSGKLVHVHGPQQPGKSPFKSSIKESQLAPCISGADASCAGLLTLDAGGKAFLFFDSLDTWRIATNMDGTGAATLTGIIDGKGAFTMAGTDAGSDGTQIMLTGKVTFAKGTFSPTKLSGKITAVSMMQGHSGTGKFKATLLPL